MEKSGAEFINLCTIDFLSQVIIAVGAFWPGQQKSYQVESHQNTFNIIVERQGEQR